jgi:hypothetical protein
MFGSKNIYFRQSAERLIIGKKDMINYLADKGYDDSQIDVYIEAYTYFVNNPDDFDGATLVKDFYDLFKLDLDAMLHDYLYIKYNAGTSFKYKKMTDMLFLHGMIKKSKPVDASVRRYNGLCISGIFFVPFSRIKRGRITDEQRKKIYKIYNLMVNSNIY